MEKEKWYEKLKAQGQSITVPMTLLMIAVAVTEELKHKYYRRL